jgi:hypothetical protein
MIANFVSQTVDYLSCLSSAEGLYIDINHCGERITENNHPDFGRRKEIFDLKGGIFRDTIKLIIYQNHRSSSKIHSCKNNYHIHYRPVIDSTENLRFSSGRSNYTNRNVIYLTRNMSFIAFRACSSSEAGILPCEIPNNLPENGCLTKNISFTGKNINFTN